MHPGIGSLSLSQFFNAWDVVSAFGAEVPVVESQGYGKSQHFEHFTICYAPTLSAIQIFEAPRVSPAAPELRAAATSPRRSSETAEDADGPVEAQVRFGVRSVP